MMIMKQPDTSIGHSFNSKQKHHKRKLLNHQSITSYISFGYTITYCLAFFVIIYLIIIFYSTIIIYQYKDYRQIRYELLQPFYNSQDKHDPTRQDQNNQNQQSNMNMNMKPILQLKQIFNNFRNEMNHQNLLNDAINEMNQLRQKNRQINTTKAIVDINNNNNINNNNRDIQQQQEQDPQQGQQQVVIPNGDIDVTTTTEKTKIRNGFILLGMHRSGTSMLAGLMVTGLGYYVGEPLIGGAYDNEKGFFELIDVVLQNDEFMNLQNIWWSTNMINYKNDIAISFAKKYLNTKSKSSKQFHYGRRALQFLNNQNNIPYLQKDPRMCITLQTWIPLLNHEPAIVWTFRHPMEVSHSLMKRESFTLDHVLRIWIVYTIRGLQNSIGLCRVYTSNELILNNPLQEVQRISNELTLKCNVPKPPNTITIENVNKFVDTTLQHTNKNKFNIGKVLEQHGNDCIVYELITDTETTNPKYIIELKLYRIAMKLYCDMKSHIAYEPTYQWPDL